MLHTNLKIRVDYFESYIWCYNHVVNQRNMVKFYTAHSSTAAVSNVKSNHVFVIRFFIKMFIFPMRFDWKTPLSEVSQVLDCIHSVRFTAYIQLHLKIQTTPGQRGASLFLGTHGMRITGGGIRYIIRNGNVCPQTCIYCVLWVMQAHVWRMRKNMEHL